MRELTPEERAFLAGGPMHVRFARANEDTNAFDFLGRVEDVTPADFERMRRECEAADGEETEVVADLRDGLDIIDTVCMRRQMHLRAASLLKLR